MSIPPTIVVDACVAAKWFLTRDEELIEEATAILHRYAEGAVALVGPDLLRIEVAAVLSAASRVSRARLTAPEAARAISDFLDLGLRFDGGSEHLAEAHLLAHGYGISFYDALYLAVARHHRATFVTADLRLYRQIGALPGVCWLADGIDDAPARPAAFVPPSGRPGRRS